MDKYLALVNKSNEFNKAMLDEFEFEKVNVNLNEQQEFVEIETLKAFQLLKKKLFKKGIVATLNSAGRTVEEQQKYFDEQCKIKPKEDVLKTTAIPGQSEHHLGLALDVNLDGVFAPIERRISPDKAKQKRDRMYDYMNTIMADFGFILRYPAEKEDKTGYPHERWHVRYVGVENAKEMTKLNMCLEEYLNYIKEQEEILTI